MSLFQRLKKDPNPLGEYTAVIKEQIQNRIVEQVKDPAITGEVGKVHYLPLHAIYCEKG